MTAGDARPVLGPSILDHFSLSPEQRLAAGERGRDVAVTAGAGTGKTRTLVARYLSLLDDHDSEGDSLRQVIAITFTRKAAREMRGRVRKEISHHLARLDGDAGGIERWQAFYRGLDAARIDTIHTLCGEILRRHPAEAGIDPRFDVLDEAAAALLTTEAVEDALAWAALEPAMSPLFEWLGERDLRELAVRLARERLKTAEIVRHVPAEGIAHHWQTALRAAQSAALERFERDQDVRAAAAVLREAQPLDPQDKMAIQRALALEALDAQGGALEVVLAGRRRLLEINRQGGRQANWRGGASELEAVKAALRDLKARWEADATLDLEWNRLDEALAGATPALYDFFGRVAAFYQARKTELGALDFDDLESRALALLERPDVAAVWEREARALLVDEFQDTNERQRMLVRRLCPQPGRLFIVGDAKQSIYRFRGADVAVFESEQARIEREGGRLVNLDVSFRAHDQLLDGMNRLLGPVLGEPGEDREAWETPFAPLRPAPAGRGRAAALPPPFIEFHLTVGTKKEAMKQAAAALAVRLNDLVATDCISFGDVAILCRATRSFSFYEDALDAAGIPYVTVAGKGFYDRPEIRELLNALRAIDDPHDDLALVGLLRSPVFGLSDASIYSLIRARQGQTLWESLVSAWLPDPEQQSRLAEAIGHVSELNDLAGRAPVADVLKGLLDRTHYRAVARLAGRPRALRNISKLLSDVHRSELVGVGRFLDYVQGLRDSGSREGEARAEAGDAVQILSIHAAKGLEFPIVVLGDAASGRRNGRVETLLDPALGILPALGEDDGESGPGKQTTRGAIYQLARITAERQEAAERKRLLYVALTRAQERLLISGHCRLNANSLGWDGWLADLWPIAGLDADSIRPNLDGGDCHVLDGDLEGTRVRAHLYGRTFVPGVAAHSQATTAETGLPGWDPALLAPLDAVPPPDAPAGPRRLWQAAPRASRDTAPAWVVGKLAHQALALWKPPDVAFDAWAEARCRELGLIGPAPLRDAVRRARLTLERFRRTDLYRRMDAAEVRRHEVPYAREVDGQVEIGYIDALFRDDGVWTVVDFKTDRPASGETIAGLLGTTDYVDQARRYGEAILALLGERPRLLLCFLGAEDADGQAVVVPVEPDA